MKKGWGELKKRVKESDNLSQQIYEREELARTISETYHIYDEEIAPIIERFKLIDKYAQERIAALDEELTPSNIYAYYLGTYRSELYKLDDTALPPHIVGQYEARLLSMDKECKESGQCKICGCKTPEMQFDTKSCKGECYPPMMDKKEWELFLENKGNSEWKLLKRTNKFFKINKQ